MSCVRATMAGTYVAWGITDRDRDFRKQEQKQQQQQQPEAIQPDTLCSRTAIAANSSRYQEPATTTHPVTLALQRAAEPSTRQQLVQGSCSVNRHFVMKAPTASYTLNIDLDGNTQKTIKYLTPPPLFPPKEHIYIIEKKF